MLTYTGRNASGVATAADEHFLGDRGHLQPVVADDIAGDEPATSIDTV